MGVRNLPTLPEGALCGGSASAGLPFFFCALLPETLAARAISFGLGWLGASLLPVAYLLIAGDEHPRTRCEGDGPSPAIRR